MNTDFWWILDALLLVAAIGIIISNAKKGMTKVLILCIGYIVATVGASVFSSISAPGIYTSMAREANIEKIEKINSNFDVAQCFMDALNDKKYGAMFDIRMIEDSLKAPDTAQFDKKLYEYVNNTCGYVVGTQMEFKQMLSKAFETKYGEALSSELPRYVYANFAASMEEDASVMNRLLEQLYAPSNNAEDMAAYLEDSFGKDPTVECFRIFIYIIIFSIVMIFAAMLASSLEYKMYFNIQWKTDHFLGAILGVVEAMMVVVLLTLIVRLLVLLGGGELLCFSDATVDRTYLFRYIYYQLDMLF